MSEQGPSRKRKAIEALLDHNAVIIQQLEGAARLRTTLEPSEDEKLLAEQARENLASIATALPPQALAGPRGQAARFVRTVRGLGLLPQLQDYEPPKKRQMLAQQEQQAQEAAAQQSLHQTTSTILQGLAARQAGMTRIGTQQLNYSSAGLPAASLMQHLQQELLGGTSLPDLMTASRLQQMGHQQMGTRPVSHQSPAATAAGYHFAILNTALQYISQDLHFTTEGGGAIVTSALLLGGAIGALSAGQTADIFGLKKAVLFNNILLGLGCLLGAIAQSIFGLTLGRVITGVGSGAATVYVPRYIAEVSPPTIRGSLSSCNQLSVCTGSLVAFVIGLPYASKTAYALNIGGVEVAWWRAMQALGILPALLQAVSMVVCPESPVWLDMLQQPSEAQKVREQLLGAAASKDAARYDADSTDLAEGLADPLVNPDELAEAEDERAGNWKDLLRKRYVKAMTLAVALPVFQQLSGISSVTFYCSEVFQDAGLTSPVLSSIGVGVVFVVGTGLAAGLMDHAGRRPLLLYSHAAMAACLLATALAPAISGSKHTAGLITLASIVVYVFSFSMGAGPIPTAYIAEILPGRIKGRAQASCMCLGWLTNLGIGLTFPYMLASLGVGGAYAVYAGLNAAAAAFVAVLMVETRHHSLAEIKQALIVY
ncbi:hypothetical protein WJX84_005596 [Apatococcus fuscideae]|uniref:Major facilitator superfamily (MFS) profile domain-containing protein n=1 Tax=Apatococcus fuscideae TaxID=2026836 RepID=A0AAW1T4B6_9CHLO